MFHQTPDFVKPLLPKYSEFRKEYLMQICLEWLIPVSQGKHFSFSLKYFSKASDSFIKCVSICKVSC